MTTVNASPVHQVIFKAAQQAALAPSVHNTQPWQFVIGDDSIEIHADESRRLKVLDPRGRQMTVSCGCALFNARVAITAAGYTPEVTRYPDPAQPYLVARIVIRERPDDSPIGRLDPYISRRKTNRRAYVPEPLPAWLVESLTAAAVAEDTALIPILTAEHRVETARLSRFADNIENADPAYRAEVFAWTTDDPRRGDGVQASTVPYLGDQPRNSSDAVPLREFDPRGMGWLPQSSHSDAGQTLILFASVEDNSLAWLRAGEALEHAWLELTREGYWASPLTQVVEVRQTHEELRAILGITEHPELLLRIGKAPEVRSSRRRDLGDMVIDERTPST